MQLAMPKEIASAHPGISRIRWQNPAKKMRVSILLLSSSSFAVEQAPLINDFLCSTYRWIEDSFIENLKIHLYQAEKNCDSLQENMK